MKAFRYGLLYRGCDRLVPRQFYPNDKICARGNVPRTLNDPFQKHQSFSFPNPLDHHTFETVPCSWWFDEGEQHSLWISSGGFSECKLNLAHVVILHEIFGTRRQTSKSKRGNTLLLFVHHNWTEYRLSYISMSQQHKKVRFHAKCGTNR